MIGRMIQAGDIETLMTKLKARRRAFHSEADFQHELAWEAKLGGIAHEARLERPYCTPNGRIAVDLVLSARSERVGIELKYWTRKLTAQVDGEEFDLANQAGQPCSRYDLWSDVARLEFLVDRGDLAAAHAIAITNDHTYWSAGQPSAIDAAFRLHDGRRQAGPLAWGSGASPGTTRGRRRTIELTRAYDVKWRDYSTVEGHRFRWLAITVLPALTFHHEQIP